MALPPGIWGRRGWAVAALALLAWLVASPAVRAGWVEDRDGKTIIHIKLWRLPDPSRTDTATRADVEAVREFVRRFPEIFRKKYRDRYRANPAKYGRHNWDHVEVELRQFSGIRVEGVETALLAIAGKVSPDVVYVNFRQSDSYIQQGFLYPLDKPEDGYVTGMTQAEQDFRIHAKIWPVIRRKGPGGKKHVWAIPWGGALGKVCLFRRDLFDAAGIPYPRSDWTWDDFYTACKKITDPARGIFGVRFGRGKHESWYWITFLWSAGAEVMVYDEPSDTWTAVFDSREAAVALDFYTRICTEPWVDQGGTRRYGYAYKDTEANIKWDRGEIGMMFSYIDEKLFTQLNPDLTGMVPVPIGPTGLRGAELNSRMMGLFAGIRDPVVRDAAWEYVRFYDCKDAMRIKTRVMVEGGLGRFVNPRYLRLFGYDELIRLAPRGWPEIFRIAIETGKPEPYGKDSNYAYDLLTEPLQRAEELSLAGSLPKDNERRLDVLQGLLRKARHKADEVMLGIVPPKVRLKRRIAAVLALIAIVVAFALVFRKVIRAFTPPPVAGQRKPGWELRRYKVAYLLLVPAVLTIFVWRYIPLVRGSVMAFMDYKIMGGSSWVWIDNFGDIIWSGDWWKAIWTSLRYSVLVISMTFLPPVILAILLQEVPRGKILFRTLFYLPAVITGLVVILLWKMFYDPSERGVLNSIVTAIPGEGFLLVGAVLFVICALFARRLLYHQKRWVAALFLVAGAAMLYTFLSLAWPIFQEQPPLKFHTRLRGAHHWLGLALLELAGLVGVVLLWRLKRRGQSRRAAMLGWAGVAVFFLALFSGYPEYLDLLPRGAERARALAATIFFPKAVGPLHPRLPEPYHLIGLLLFGAAGLTAIALIWRLCRRGRKGAAAAFGWGSAAVFYGLFFVAYPEYLNFLPDGVPAFVLFKKLFLTLPEPYRWLGSSDTALFCCVLPMVWAGMGPGCLIYLAALKGIADDFYEAADVDGATFIDKILFVIFPILKPLLIINFVGVFIGSWKSTANILAMTGGGYDTEVAGLHIFYRAFIFLKFGPATAMAWMLGFLLIGFTVHQLTILSRLEFRTTGGDDKK